MQIWGEGLSELKKDGQNKYLGAGQQLWITSSQKGLLGEQSLIQLNCWLYIQQ